MSKKDPIKGYFFWSYDQFPYLLGSEGWLQPDGYAMIPAYGNAKFFPTLQFLGKKGIRAGKFFAQDLNALKAERETMLLRICASFNQDVAALRKSAEVHATLRS